MESLVISTEHTFESLYTDHYSKLCTYLLNYTYDREKIEDVVQDTFITFWSKRNEIEITTSLKSYLYRCAYNKLIDSLREKNKINNMLESYYHTAVNNAEKIDDYDKSDRLELLESCLEKLPNKCKNIFVSCKLKGKKHQEIAQELDISLKTVEGHINKAYKLLKDCAAKLKSDL